MKAFPNGVMTDGKGLIIGGQHGMDLRDYFAAQAMMGLLSNSYLAEKSPMDRIQISTTAYFLADAMMKEREQ